MRPSPTIISAITLMIGMLPLTAIHAQQEATKSGTSSTPAASQSAPFRDAPAPEPTPALKTLMDAIDKQLQSKQFDAALAAADTALRAAQSAQDHFGEAMSHGLRAWALEGLNKTDEAVNAWKSAAEIWRTIPDGPGHVEALANEGILLMRSRPAEAKYLLSEAISQTRSELMRPLYSAAVLNLAAERALDKRLIGIVPPLEEAALSQLEKLAPGSLAVARSLNSLGIAAYYRKDLETAQALWKRALDIEEKKAPDSFGVPNNLLNLGNIEADRANPAAAESYYNRALAIFEKLAPGSLDVAIVLGDLGTVAADQHNVSAANDFYRRSLVIYEKLAPDSLNMADLLNNMAKTARLSGDRPTAVKYFKRALDIEDKLAPGSEDEVPALMTVGVSASDHGDVEAAEQYLKRVQEIELRLGPDSDDMAVCLSGLGHVARVRGELTAAEGYYKSALVIQQKRAPESLDVSYSLTGLGLIASDRSDFGTAESFHKRALEIQEKLAPESLDVANSLNNLGIVARSRGELAEAETCFTSALEIREKLAPTSIEVAYVLNNLGNVYRDRGEGAKAESNYNRELEIEQSVAPNSLPLAGSLNQLGTVYRDRDENAKAEEFFHRALEIQEKLAPGSLDAAKSLVNLGTLDEKLHRLDDALRHYAKASDIIEYQRGSIMGAEARKLLTEVHADAFASLTRVLVKLHRDDTAFDNLERTRGRSLSDNLFEHKNIDFSKEAPANIIAEQQKLDNDRSIALKVRESLDLNDEAGLRKNTAALQEINARQRQLEDEIRNRSPRYGNLQYPKPLDLKSVQSILDPGTLLLEYAIDESQTFLFTVTRTSLRSYVVNIEGKDLSSKIKVLAASLEKQDAPNNPGVAVELYNLLVRPAQKEILAASRLLICPEKELWKIPFCALIDNNNTVAPHYLVEIKPIHSIVSMNVYAQLLTSRGRKHTSAHPLLAFGDPAYGPTPQNRTTSIGAAPTGSATPAALATNTQVHRIADSGHPAVDKTTKSLLLGGHDFPRYTVTGDQARAIGNLYGSGAVVHLGKEATPAAVVKEAGSARILHFACHGWMDGADPLASFIALAPEHPGDQFGRLAAYDVIQNLHLDADLVTLAACETGAGEQTGTEGVIGLTRAFEYAGAHSVLVALWEIDANSSSQLMCGTASIAHSKAVGKAAIANSFYGALRAGASKDVALQKAQIALIHGKREEYRDPRAWAAFSLQGDWQ